jgi:hypothetical protein
MVHPGVRGQTEPSRRVLILRCEASFDAPALLILRCEAKPSLEG